MLDPTNPYAASKVGAEACVQSFVKSFKIPAVIIRLNNVMGPHQYPESESLPTSQVKLTQASEVIPKFINLLRRKRPLLIHGDGLHTRRYLYAGDAAEAFDTILHRGTMGEIYNVDSAYEYSNIEVAKKLLGAFGISDTASWIQHADDRAFNDRRYAVDGTKLRNLGWKQTTTFDEALAITVDWYNRFSTWWGDIEGVLSAHPIVQGDHIISANSHQPEEAEGDAEVEVGARDDRASAVIVNGKAAEENGLKASKKRKADVMTAE